MEEEKRPATTISQNNRRIAKNTMMLYFRMILTMLVSLYTSRVILNTLGVEDYGIYNVVGGVIAMFSFFNNAMSSATQRFFSYELGKGDFDQLRRTFNASQIIHFAIAIIILILAETVGSWFIKNYLVIPVERIEAVLWVYHFSVLSFVLTIIQVPYNSTIISHEKMNVYAYVSILEVGLKLLIVFMLSWVSFDKLKLYGALHFVVILLITTIYKIYTIRNFKETKFQIVKDKKLYKILISFSGWTLYESLALVAKGQGVNITLNLFFGPVVNAAQGIANQVHSALNSFVSNFQTAVKPQIFKSHASGENGYMTSLLFRSTKFSFYLLLVITLPIVIEIDQILQIWLVTVPEYTSIFTVLILFVGLIICYSGPMKAAIQATGKIKTYQIVIGTMQILILPISYFYLKAGYPPSVVLYITIIIEVISLLFRLYFLHSLIGFPVVKFVKEVLANNLIIILLASALPLFMKYKMEESILRLLLILFVSTISNMILIYYVGLQGDERKFIKMHLFRIFNKKQAN